MSGATGPSAPAEYRAAGTDLSERRRSGVSTGPIIDLSPTEEQPIQWGEDGAAMHRQLPPHRGGLQRTPPGRKQRPATSNLTPSPNAS